MFAALRAVDDVEAGMKHRQAITAPLDPAPPKSYSPKAPKPSGVRGNPGNAQTTYFFSWPVGMVSQASSVTALRLRQLTDSQASLQARNTTQSAALTQLNCKHLRIVMWAPSTYKTWYDTCCRHVT